MILKSFFKSFTSLTVVIAGTGYLIDMFDLFLFNMVRVSSLKDLGLTAEQVTQTGIYIINAQLLGLIIGAYVWGVLGDRLGRKKVLLGSILLYSICSLLTAAVQNEWQYGALRLLTGIGLAGELGAGIALISEKYSDNRRGVGVGIFIILGFVGVLFASLSAQNLDWRTCYVIGGIMGLVLLIFRFKLHESALFENIKAQSHGLTLGGLKPIFSQKSLIQKYVFGILLLLPTVFIPQIVWSLSPEIALAKGIEGIQPAKILGLGYTCVIIGDLLAIILAEKLKSRRAAIGVFLALGCIAFGLYIFYPYQSVNEFYFFSSALGIAFGTWVVGTTMIAEMFGTNLRATAATTIPNFCRGCVILMNTALIAMKPVLGIETVVTMIGVVIFALSVISIYFLQDTYGRNLEFVDPDGETSAQTPMSPS